MIAVSNIPIIEKIHALENEISFLETKLQIAIEFIEGLSKQIVTSENDVLIINEAREALEKIGVGNDFLLAQME